MLSQLDPTSVKIALDYDGLATCMSPRCGERARDPRSMGIAKDCVVRR